MHTNIERIVLGMFGLNPMEILILSALCTIPMTALGIVGLVMLLQRKSGPPSRTCRNCGQAVADADRHCRQCGQALS